MRDEGVAKKFLGINIDQRDDGIHLSATDYIDKLLAVHGMSDCKANKVPMNGGGFVEKNSRRLGALELAKYRSLVGGLVFATNTVRFDLAYAVNQLSRHFNDATEEHMTAAKGVCRYLQSTRKLALRYTKDLKFEVFADADWGGCKETRKSTTGYMTIFGGCPLTWKCATQHVVARSSTEAEYYAAGEAVKEIL